MKRIFSGIVGNYQNSANRHNQSFFPIRHYMGNAKLLEEFLTKKIKWDVTSDAEYPYVANYSGKVLKIRVNDFPDEPLYSLVENGKVISHLESWPESWNKPNINSLHLN